jgi:hypothetical protein
MPLETPWQRAQFLIDEPGYIGILSQANSCGPGVIANGSFENGIGAGNQGYGFSPGATGNGPAAIFDLVQTGIYGPQTCTLSIRDTKGLSATITLKNEALLLYSGQKGPQPTAGALGVPVAYDGYGGATPSPAPSGSVPAVEDWSQTFLVYEQGYNGVYSLDPSSCAYFTATLVQGATPNSGATLSVHYHGPSPQETGCTFVVRDMDGQHVTYTGVPLP